MICGTSMSSRWSTSKAVAPASRASRAKSCPSEFAPLRQQNSEPACTRRESKATEVTSAAVTSRSPANSSNRPRLAPSTTSYSRRDIGSSFAALATGVVRCRADLELVHGDGGQRREKWTSRLAAEVILVAGIRTVDRHENRHLWVVGREVADERRVVLLGTVVGLVVGSRSRVRLPAWNRRRCRCRCVVSGGRRDRVLLRGIDGRLQQRRAGLAGD